MKKIVLMLIFVFCCFTAAVSAEDAGLIFGEPHFYRYATNEEGNGVEYKVTSITDEDAMDYIRGRITVTNQTDESKSFRLIFAYYDGNKLLNSTVSDPLTVNNNSRSSFVKSVNIGRGDQNGRSVKVYAWTDCDRLIPISDVFVLDSLSNEKAIIDFTVDGGETEIDAAEKIIRLYMPNGSDITAVVPQITVSEGAVIYPPSGSEINGSEPVVYTVTASNGSSVDYTLYTYTAEYKDGDFDKYIDGTILSRYGTNSSTNANVAVTDSSSVGGNGKAVRIIANGETSWGLNVNFASVSDPLKDFDEIVTSFRYYQNTMAKYFMASYSNSSYSTVLAPFYINWNNCVTGRSDLKNGTYVYGSAANGSAAALADESWQNIKLVYSRETNQTRLYIDGVYKGNTHGSFGADVNSLFRLQFKTNTNTPDGVTVWLDDIAVYSR